MFGTLREFSVERPETFSVVADRVVIVAFPAETVWAVRVLVIDAPDRVARPHMFSVVVVSVPETVAFVEERVVITALVAEIV